MNILLGNIGTIFSNILNWLIQMSSSLLTNPIFIILMSVIILTLFINLLVNLINNIRKNKKTYTKNIFDTPVKEWTNDMYDEDVLWSYTHDNY